MRDDQYVYFIKPIGMDGPIKIGCSHIPETRLEHLMIWAPFPLELLARAPGTLKEENAVHGVFSHLHSHNEWFNYAPELDAAIQETIATGSIEHILKMEKRGSIRKKRVAHVYTDDRRKYLSYAARIRNACRRFEAWREPAVDIQEILQRWEGSDYYGIERTTPTAAEFARLDEFLSNPAAHCVAPQGQKVAA